MRCWRSWMWLCAALSAACDGPEPALPQSDALPPILSAERAADAPRPPPLTVDVVVADGIAPPGARGTLVVSHVLRDERMSLREGLPPPALSMELVQRATLLRDQSVAAPLRVTIPHPGADAMLWVYFDHAHAFWSSLFGAGGGDNLLGVGSAPIGAGAAVSIALDTVLGPRPEPPEACVGEQRELLSLDAPALVGSMGNTPKRRLCVQLPASYLRDPARRYPVLYLYPGFSGSDTARLNGDEGAAKVADELAASGVEVIMVGIESRTMLGSSYFADSPTTGAWADHPLRVVREIDQRYRTKPVREARALLGKSTGGFTVAEIGLRHSDTFGAWAACAPDALDMKSWLLAPDGKARERVRRWTRFEDAIGGMGQMPSYAADWSPDASAPRGFVWPFDLDTGVPEPDVLARWLAHSPAQLLDDPAIQIAARAKLQDRIFINVGDKDEFDLHPPAKAFSDKLRMLGIAHTFLVNPGGHFGTKPPLVPQAARWAIRKLHE